MNKFKSHGEASALSMDSVKRVLHHVMRDVQDHRGWLPIHASDITKEGNEEFCPRQVVLHLIDGDMPNKQSISTCTQFMFDLGRFIESLVRDKYLRDYVFGHWICDSCGAETDTPMMFPGSCGCGSTAITYKELNLKRFGIASCGVDMLVRLPGDEKFTLYEIKSLERKYFEELMGPKSEHLNRTRLYLGFAGDDPELKDIVHLDHAKILYVCKGWGKKENIDLMDGVREKFTPFVEFDVKASPETVEYYDKRIIPVKEFYDKGVVPSGICKTPNSPRAKYCPKKSTCFSAYPAGEVHHVDTGA
jgi:hypothetical protein